MRQILPLAFKLMGIKTDIVHETKYLGALIDEKLK